MALNGEKKVVIYGKMQCNPAYHTKHFAIESQYASKQNDSIELKNWGIIEQVHTNGKRIVIKTHTHTQCRIRSGQIVN